MPGELEPGFTDRNGSHRHASRVAAGDFTHRRAVRPARDPFLKQKGVTMRSPWNVRTSRRLHRAIAASTLIVVFSLALAPFAAAAPVDTSQSSGPITDQDRDVLLRVRQAGLWEGPVSAQVAMRTQNPKVKAVAEQLAHEHHILDEATLAAASKLGVSVPDTASPQQQGWVTQILSAPPQQMDKLYVGIVRSAHGLVFTIIAADRAATQNDVMRAFAQSGIDFVMRHMMMLETTGLVDSNSLVTPISGPTSQAAIAPSLPDSGSVVLGIALAGVAVLATITIVRVLGKTTPEGTGGGLPIAALSSRELT